MDREPIVQNGTLLVSADTVAKALQVNVKFNADKNMVLITTPRATEQFNKEDQAVKDILNGVGMIPHIAVDGAKEFKLTAEIGPWSPVKGVLTKDNAANVTKYDHDYTMLLSGFQINGSESEKDYFTINGRSYPDTTPIVVKKGETVRLRLINIDAMEVHTMHMHGLDF